MIIRTESLATVELTGNLVSREPGTKEVADFSEADAAMAPSLERLEGASNYAGWIFSHVEPYLGVEVLEVGAGHGTITGLMAQQAKRLVASDLSERCAAILRMRFQADSSVEILHGSISEAAERGPFDAVVLINVLEHIEDDDGALRDIAAVLKPGGRIILWVPALPMLYGEFDRKVGHFRRYRKPGLRHKLTHAGYDVQDIRYVNAVGSLAWLLSARLLGKSPNRKASLRIFDRYLVPVLSTVERRAHPPFGQSLFAAAVWPNDFELGGLRVSFTVSLVRLNSCCPLHSPGHSSAVRGTADFSRRSAS